MKNTFTLIILVFLVSCSQYPNQKEESRFEKYDKFLWQAMLDYSEKDFTKSYSNFQNSFKIIQHDNVDDYFYAASAALKIEKIKEAEKLIKDAIQFNNASKEYFRNFEGFDGFRQFEFMTEIEENYDKYLNQFMENLEHPDIFIEINDMIELDQKVRQDGVSDEEMIRIDSININRLKEITMQYGWQEHALILLWHQRGFYKEDNDVWSYFRPLIDSLINTGKIRKDYWSRYEDESAIFESKEQIYGHYWLQYEMFPIKDIANVDKRRKDVDLPPLWYMNKVYDVTLPKGYKIPAKTTIID